MVLVGTIGKAVSITGLPVIITLISIFFAIATLGLLTLRARSHAGNRQGALIKMSEVALTAAPIPCHWLIEGNPTTEAAEIARTADGSTCVYVWQTTRASYRWHHESDETVTIVSGDVFLSTVTADVVGPEQRLGAGDACFFPTGSTTLWRVPNHLQKISTLTRPTPWPVAYALYRLRAIKRWVLSVVGNLRFVRRIASEG